MSLHNMQQFSQINEVTRFSGNATGAACGSIDDSLRERFDACFEVIFANSTELIRTAQRIRYQVYCVERQFEQPRNLDTLERDVFDTHAVHSVLVHRPTNMALATVRLILPAMDGLEHSFPVQKVLDAASLRLFNRLPVRSTAEVSRFSISRELWRAARAMCNQEHAGLLDNSGPLMRLGLIQSLVHMSFQHHITHWCAVMEPTLLRMLSAMAMRFRPIGPLVDYHGLRQPCYCVVEDVLHAMRHERPAFWAMLTNCVRESAVEASIPCYAGGGRRIRS